MKLAHKVLNNLTWPYLTVKKMIAPNRNFKPENESVPVDLSGCIEESFA